MNYFELYAIPVSLQPDQVQVKAQFYALSRKYHPDFYGQGTEEEQAEALELSSQVNLAYKTLQNPDELIKYVLRLKGLLEEEEKYTLSPDFLMEMMDLNEMAMEASDAEAKEAVKQSVQTIQKEIYEPVETIITHYQDGITTEKELLQVKEYYFRKKYLDRVVSGML